MLRLETGLLDLLLADPQAAFQPLDHPALHRLEEDVNTFGSAERIPPVDQVRDRHKLEEYYSYPSFLEFRDDVAELAQRFKDLSEGGLLTAVSHLFEPDPEPLEIHLLPIGHTMGDAYVREIDGRPVICVNLAVVARFYGQSNDERWQDLVPVLEHEVFHVYFARERARSRYWQDFLGALTPLREAQLILLDEGIGHFIGHRANIARYLAERRETLQKVLTDCWQALERLADPSLATAEAREIILRGTVGEFFTKYLSIAGMLGAYALFSVGGFPALRRCLEDLACFHTEGMARVERLLTPPLKDA